MQACRYLRIDFCAAHGIPYGPIVEQWALIAMAAESEAQNILMDRASEG